MQPVDLNVTGFVVNAENTEHFGRHGVIDADLDEVLGYAPQFFENPPSPTREATHLMIGPNRSGRFILAAIIEEEPGKWRTITAHWFHRRLALRHYTRVLP